MTDKSAERKKFVVRFAKNSGQSSEWAELGLIEVGTYIRLAMPCNCGAENCNGWQMVAPDLAPDIALALAAERDALQAENRRLATQVMSSDREAMEAQAERDALQAKLDKAGDALERIIARRG